MFHRVRRPSFRVSRQKQKPSISLAPPVRSRPYPLLPPPVPPSPKSDRSIGRSDRSERLSLLCCCTRGHPPLSLVPSAGMLGRAFRFPQQPASMPFALSLSLSPPLLFLFRRCDFKPSLQLGLTVPMRFCYRLQSRAKQKPPCAMLSGPHIGLFCAAPALVRGRSTPRLRLDSSSSCWFHEIDEPNGRKPTNDVPLISAGVFFPP